jgi:class 3 adenylate cyclase
MESGGSFIRGIARSFSVFALAPDQSETPSASMASIVPTPAGGGGDLDDAEDDPIAHAFPEVSVMFVYIANFNSLANLATPMELVTLLNQLYTLLDDIVEMTGIYKVMAVGNMYMCVAGALDNNEDHLQTTIDTAVAILATVGRMKHEYSIGGRPFEIHVGINVGEVAAGIIGTRAYHYHVFGDAVNVASRMASSGEPDRIQMTETCFNIIKARYPVVLPYAAERGSIFIKGKGDMRTFWFDDPLVFESTVGVTEEGEGLHTVVTEDGNLPRAGDDADNKATGLINGLQSTMLAIKQRLRAHKPRGSALVAPYDPHLTSSERTPTGARTAEMLLRSPHQPSPTSPTSGLSRSVSMRSKALGTLRLERYSTKQLHSAPSLQSLVGEAARSHTDTSDSSDTTNVFARAWRRVRRFFRRSVSQVGPLPPDHPMKRHPSDLSIEGAGHAPMNDELHHDIVGISRSPIARSRNGKPSKLGQDMPLDLQPYKQSARATPPKKTVTVMDIATTALADAQIEESSNKKFGSTGARFVHGQGLNPITLSFVSFDLERQYWGRSGNEFHNGVRQGLFFAAFVACIALVRALASTTEARPVSFPVRLSYATILRGVALCTLIASSLTLGLYRPKIRPHSLFGMRFYLPFFEKLATFALLAFFACLCFEILTSNTALSGEAGRPFGIIMALLISFSFVELRGITLALLNLLCFSVDLGVIVASEEGEPIIAAALGLSALATAISSAAGYFRERSRRKNFVIRQLAQRQKEKCERLLMNMLPSQWHVERLMAGEQVVEVLDDVTILFSDIKGFTQLASKLSPEDLIKFLDSIYASFDQHLDVFGLYKIDTIGDAFIVLGGMTAAQQRARARCDSRSSTSESEHADGHVQPASDDDNGNGHVIAESAPEPKPSPLPVHAASLPRLLSGRVSDPTLEVDANILVGSTSANNRRGAFLSKKQISSILGDSMDVSLGHRVPNSGSARAGAIDSVLRTMSEARVQTEGNNAILSASRHWLSPDRVERTQTDTDASKVRHLDDTEHTGDDSPSVSGVAANATPVAGSPTPSSLRRKFADQMKKWSSASVSNRPNHGRGPLRSRASAPLLLQSNSVDAGQREHTVTLENALGSRTLSTGCEPMVEDSPHTPLPVSPVSQVGRGSGTDSPSLRGAHAVSASDATRQLMATESDTPHVPLSHAGAVALFAMDMQREMARIRSETGIDVELRIGIHTGRVVGGIIGKSRPRYFVWGSDAVLANLLESTGIGGQIQVSDATASRLIKEGFELEQHQVIRLQETDEGSQEILQDKGEVIKTFLVRKFVSDDGIEIYVPPVSTPAE